MLEWIAICVAGVILYSYVFSRSSANSIPGPRGLPVIGNAFQIHVKKPHVQLSAWAKIYGGIYQLNLMTTPTIVVTDPKLLHSMLVTKGDDFGGRPDTYRFHLSSLERSGVILTDAGPIHKTRRKLVQSYLKQYGSGTN